MPADDGGAECFECAHGDGKLCCLWSGLPRQPVRAHAGSICGALLSTCVFACPSSGRSVLLGRLVKDAPALWKFSQTVELKGAEQRVSAEVPAEKYARAVAQQEGRPTNFFPNRTECRKY